MGRVEKKFQKKKERERAVWKKILAKRAKSREASKEMHKADKLERAINKRDHKPIRNISPELQKTLDVLGKIKAEEVRDKSIFDDPSVVCNADDK